MRSWPYCCVLPPVSLVLLCVPSTLFKLPSLQEHLYAFMDLLLRRAKRHADARPFLVPVPAEDVPDYYTIIVVGVLSCPAAMPCCMCMSAQAVA